MRSQGHLLHLDVLKGFAIFLVVLTHLFSFGLGVYAHIVPKALEGVRMPLFMLIAGYFMSRPWPLTGAGRGTFWRKQLIRLLLPLTLTPLCYALWMGYTMDGLIWETKHLGYWFTWVLFEMFLLLYLVRWVNLRLNRTGDLRLELLLLFLSIVGVGWLDYGLQLIPKVYGLLSMGELNRYYLYFVLGYSLKRLPRLESYLYLDIVTAPALLLTVLQIHGAMNGAPHLWGSLSLNLTSILAALGLGRRLTRSEGRITRVMAYLGKQSRGIYLFHFFFLPFAPAVKEFIRGIHPHTRALSWELLFTSVMSVWVILLSLGIVCLVQASPILNMLLLGKEPSRDAILKPKQIP